MYGPTEVTTFSTWHRIESVPENAKTIPIGKPIANTQAYVLDEEISLCPAGIPGELYLAGEGLARGYLNQPDLTAVNFVPNPSLNWRESGCTGQETWYSDGSTAISSSSDVATSKSKFAASAWSWKKLKTRCWKHASVQQPLSYAVSPCRRESDCLDTWFRRRRDAHGSELRDHLKDALPDYMVPSGFVEMEQLPLNPNGKVDRKALPEARGEFDDEAVADAETQEEEQILCAIFAEMLQLPHVGFGADFFEIGGHSLLATQAISRLENLWRSICPCARCSSPLRPQPWRKRYASSAPPAMAFFLRLSRAERSGELPLSYAQQRLWFLEQLEPGGHLQHSFQHPAGGDAGQRRAEAQRPGAGPPA